jgi:hypothetical protein
MNTDDYSTPAPSGIWEIDTQKIAQMLESACAEKGVEDIPVFGVSGMIHCEIDEFDDRGWTVVRFFVGPVPLDLGIAAHWTAITA